LFCHAKARRREEQPSTRHPEPVSGSLEVGALSAEVLKQVQDDEVKKNPSVKALGVFCTGYCSKKAPKP